MKVWIVTRWGVNVQGIVGVFSSEERALDAQKTAKLEEPDNYHRFNVDEYELDVRHSLETD